MTESGLCRASAARVLSRWLLPAVLVVAGACATPPPADGTPDFSTAASRHEPLGVVAGAAAPSPLDRSPDSIDYSDPVGYAESMGSYSLLIWHAGALRVEEYFSGHGPSLRSESASLHKTVLALTVAAAIDDGLIDDPQSSASDWLIEWQDSARQQIRIVDLLTMSSGLRPLSWEGGMTSEAGQFLSGGDTVRRTLLAMEPEATAGSVFRYANTDSQLLALVLERATGEAYENYLSGRIWKRLGAADAYVWLNEADGFPRTYTALLARARDWLRIGLVIKDRGTFAGEQIVRADLIDRMTAASERNPGYGWQLWRGIDRVGQRYYNEAREGLSVAQSEPFSIEDWLFLDGWGGQRVYISRRHDLVVVRLGDARTDWDDAELPNRVAAALGVSG